jgi:DNA invertase Pin-like site-specific DNA recombinase
MATTQRLVEYRRVSTSKQGISGLGMKAQEECVRRYCQANNAKVIATYTEVESGRRASRPELQKAIMHAKRANAKLIVARLDRLARNVHFLSGLMESGVDFLACDMPQVNKLTVHVLAAVAEAEAEAASIRTKAALAALKARGAKLGNPAALTDEAAAKGRPLGVQAVKAKAAKFAADLGPIVAELRGQNYTLQKIADHLNELGFQTPRKKSWTPTQVMRVLAPQPRGPLPR